jgi:hypothetical protein
MVKMKYEILIYVVSIALIISGTVVTILHMGNGYQFMFYGCMIIATYHSWLIERLKKRIKELEQNQ